MNKSTIIGAFQLARPINSLISALSIFVAVFITGTLEPVSNVIMACLSGAIIMAAANTINDYYDLEIDKINKPNRPLITGIIKPETAFKLSLQEFSLGICLSIFINLHAFLIALTVSVFIFFYSYLFKRMPLIGNFIVSLSTGMAFLYGGAAVNRMQFTIIPAILAFFFHFGREIIKDIQDMEGDEQRHARTFPILYGKSAALILTSLNFILLVPLLIIPYYINWYSIKYLVVVLIGILPVIFFVVISMWNNPSQKNLGFLSNLLKADMLVGLCALYVG
jgi:geranylgeranylglycerol-phosphate geranylgeranyltransferase